MKSIILKHINEHISILNSFDEDMIKEISFISSVFCNAIKKNKTIFWCGNGGSASDSQHLAAELIGRFDKNRRPFRSISLTADSSVLTCISNDFGFDNVFSRQVEGLSKSGDIIVGISTSGLSKNVINALKSAKQKNMTTVGFLGKGGGNQKKYCDYSIVIDSLNTARIQECHIMLGHIICDLIERKLDLAQ